MANNCSNQNRGVCGICSISSNEPIQPKFEFLGVSEVKINENMFELYSKIEVNCYDCIYPDYPNKPCQNRSDKPHELVDFDFSMFSNNEKVAFLVILCFEFTSRIQDSESAETAKRILEYINKMNLGGKCYLWPLIYFSQDDHRVNINTSKLKARIRQYDTYEFDNLFSSIRDADKNVNLISDYFFEENLVEAICFEVNYTAVEIAKEKDPFKTDLLPFTLKFS